MVKKKEADNIQVRVSLKERDLILNYTLADPGLTDRLRMAVTKSKWIVVSYSLDELDELIVYIAAEANHTNDEKLRDSLDRLFGRLSDLYNSRNREDLFLD